MKPLRIGLITIGDEILSGRTQDTNASWLARYLFKKGFCLSSVVTAGDDRESLSRAMDFSLGNNEIVFTSGGLGPTEDDRTKKIVAQFFGLPLADSEVALGIVRGNYERQKKSWNPRSYYHQIPRSARPISNPVGLAPGLIIDQDDRLLLAAPGVPREFQAMVQGELFPYLRPRLPEGREQRMTIRSAGIEEEKIFLNSSLWDQLSRFGKVSSLPGSVGVDIIVHFDSHHLESKKKEIKALLEESFLRPYIWTWDERSLEEVIVDEAQRKNLSFSFAESCTGGLAGHRITNVPGASSVFLGSFVTYSNELKIKALGVRESTLRSHGAVSVEVANEMAHGARERAQSAVGLSFSGLAGPGGGGSEGRPVGMLAVSVATLGGVSGRISHAEGDRERRKWCFCRTGLLWLLETLKSLH